MTDRTSPFNLDNLDVIGRSIRISNSHRRLFYSPTPFRIIFLTVMPIFVHQHVNFLHPLLKLLTVSILFLHRRRLIFCCTMCDLDLDFVYSNTFALGCYFLVRFFFFIIFFLRSHSHVFPLQSFICFLKFLWRFLLPIFGFLFFFSLLRFLT